MICVVCCKMFFQEYQKCEECRILNMISARKYRLNKKNNTSVDNLLFFNNTRFNILKKLNAYRRSDIKYNRKVINYLTLDYVLKLLEECQYKCYYCCDPLLVHYKKWDLKQFSVDRILNHYGHDKSNIVICCVSCNLKRNNKDFCEFLYSL